MSRLAKKQKESNGKAVLHDMRNEPEAARRIIGEAVATGWGDCALRHQMWDYYAAVAGDNFTDLSVVLTVAGKPVALVLANDAHGGIGYFGRPLMLVFPDGFERAQDQFEAILFDHYDTLAKKSCCSVSFVAPRRNDNVMGSLALKAAGRGGVNQLVHQAVIDLTMEEAEIRRAIRKSYRSLINWGERHLTSVIINHENPDRPAFDAFQEFHARIAGRQTRPQESWDRMFDNVVEDNAELVAGYLDGELLAGTFVNYSNSHALYSTGVYDRGQFDKPLSHWPVYHSIIRAKQRGCQTFDLGEVFMGLDRNEKERNIAFFKKGFSKRVESMSIWRLNAKFESD